MDHLHTWVSYECDVTDGWCRTHRFGQRELCLIACSRPDLFGYCAECGQEGPGRTTLKLVK